MTALLFGALFLLIPNALFALFLVWVDLSDNGTMTRLGRRYITITFGFIAAVLIAALMGLVGMIETMGM